MTFKDHFSDKPEEYAASRPGYPEELFEFIIGHCPQREIVWDCATGSGQAAKEWSRYFKGVIASDASGAQLQSAFQAANISYRAFAAENTPLPSHSVDLVSVAQALHWFDTEAFFNEVKRVCKPGGCLAVWGYGLTTITENIDAIVSDFYTNTVGTYWPPERRLIEDRYQSIDFPFQEIETPEFQMRLQWSAQEFLQYISTWSAVKRYIKAKEEDPVILLQSSISPYWPAEEKLEVRWPLFLRLGVV